MKNKELNSVKDTIENEGFEYALVHYSDFKEIKDEKFHRLRKAYTEARSKLAKYLNVEE